MQNLPADIGQRPLLPLVPQHPQQLLQQRLGLGVEDVVVQAPGIVLPRGGVGVPLLLIYLAGGDTVAEHLHHIVDRHLHPAHFVLQLRGVVDPIFQVVPVSPLVVEPGGGVAPLQALHLVGAAVSLKIFHTRQELHGAVLAHIVEQSLPVQPHPKAIFHDPVFMGGDSLQMAPEAGHFLPSAPPRRG